MKSPRLSPEPTIHEGSVIESTRIGAWTEIGEKNHLENTEMGDWSYTGPFCIIQNARIGRFSNIAAMVRIGPTAHPMDRPTQHHFTYRRMDYGLSDTNDEDFFSWRAAQVARIGHDTWLGHGAVIMPGVTVGIGAVIGGGAVVTRDIGDYEVAVGVPAKQVKRRLSKIQARDMMKIAWWEWDYETIRERTEDFVLPVDEFLEKYGN
ncbi:MAG: hypothetical protein RQ801_01320 [Spirochaetaceae bacterium]|nr:hypothetical protein [Spirochaetaceae bacterium]MDT8296911.1 hypothetical protein [Spirochaetaceae bacterium]